MTVEQFRLALRAQPFRPFALRTGDGREYRVDHPEMALLTPNGRTVAVVAGNDSVAILDLLLVHAIEFQGAASEPPGGR
jgi:hypothetical protein